MTTSTNGGRMSSVLESALVIPVTIAVALPLVALSIASLSMPARRTTRSLREKADTDAAWTVTFGADFDIELRRSDPDGGYRRIPSYGSLRTTHTGIEFWMGTATGPARLGARPWSALISSSAVIVSNRRSRFPGVRFETAVEGGSPATLEVVLLKDSAVPRAVTGQALAEEVARLELKRTASATYPSETPSQIAESRGLDKGLHG